MNISYSNFSRKKPATFQLTFNEKLGKIIVTRSTIGRPRFDHGLQCHRIDEVLYLIWSCLSIVSTRFQELGQPF
jgi:hypothetical protein